MKGRIIRLDKQIDTGTQARSKNAQVFTEKQVIRHLKDQLPCFPIHNVESPILRAFAARTRAAGRWTKESVQEAASEFLIPSGTKILVVFPELFYRDILFAYPEFQVIEKDEKQPEKSKVVGVKSPCPFCKTNKSVRFLKWECQQQVSTPRRVMDVDALPIFLASPRMECLNEECVGAVPKGTFDDDGNLLDENGDVALTKSKFIKWNRSVHKSKIHSFILASKSAFSQCPEDIKGLHASHCYGLATDDAPQMCAAPKLAQDVLDASKTLSGMARTLKNHYSVVQEAAAREHQTFVKTCGEAKKPPSDIVPLLFRAPELPDIMWPEPEEHGGKCQEFKGSHVEGVSRRPASMGRDEFYHPAG
jgi:hypothetical protein